MWWLGPLVAGVKSIENVAVGGRSVDDWLHDLTIGNKRNQTVSLYRPCLLTRAPR